jgi:molybdate transport system substrate-binding protein
LGVIAAATVSACGARPEPTTSITVYAASSLIRGFTAIAKEFEAANPTDTVQFVFAGSPELSTALAGGASADVFASGDPVNMTVAVAAGVASGRPVPFAADRLVVVTPAGNPQHLVTPGDLTRPGLRVSVCEAQSSCGMATQSVESETGIRLRASTSEATPIRVVDAVTGGRADAGVVHASDAQRAGNAVSWFPLPGGEEAVTSWITVVRGTGHAGEAARFVDAVTSASGMRILAGEGFSEPLKNPTG